MSVDEEVRQLMEEMITQDAQSSDIDWLIDMFSQRYGALAASRVTSCLESLTQPSLGRYLANTFGFSSFGGTFVAASTILAGANEQDPHNITGVLGDQFTEQAPLIALGYVTMGVLGLAFSLVDRSYRARRAAEIKVLADKAREEVFETVYEPGDIVMVCSGGVTHLSRGSWESKFQPDRYEVIAVMQKGDPVEDLSTLKEDDAVQVTGDDIIACGEDHPALRGFLKMAGDGLRLNREYSPKLDERNPTRGALLISNFKPSHNYRMRFHRLVHREKSYTQGPYR